MNSYKSIIIVKTIIFLIEIDFKKLAIFSIEKIGGGGGNYLTQPC